VVIFKEREAATLRAMAKNASVALLLGLGGLAIVVAAWRGAIARLPRNRWVGIRVPSTMRSDEAWRAAHVAAAKPLLASGVAAIGSAVVALAYGSTPGRLSAVVLTSAVLVLGLTLVGAVVGVRAANRTGA
jgi:VIT1/CCC1 family predicted Fe2+/Mn2+ transporter